MIDCSKKTLNSLLLHVLFPETPTDIVLLPGLRSLTLAADSFFASSTTTPVLRAPSLTNLSLRPLAIQRAPLSLLQHLSDTVTYLTLGDAVGASDLTKLANLHKLSHLAFVKSSIFLNGYKVADEFFGQLADSVPRIWPKLASIVLQPKGSIHPVGGDGILRLITMRKARALQGAGADSTDGQQPCVLREVVLQYDNAPAWLVAEAERLLAD